MNKEIAVIIFPNQIFENINFSFNNRDFLLIEDPLFFRDRRYPMNYHKQKLILHRSSMKFYESYLKERGATVRYLEWSRDFDGRYFDDIFKDYRKIEYYEPNDFILEKRIVNSIKRLGLDSVELENPQFITPKEKLFEYESNINRNFFHKNFYEWQRRRLKILVNSEGDPIGGKFSFDEENRKKIPKNLKLPKEVILNKNLFVKEAIEYVSKNFKDNFGEINFNYPVDFQSSKEWFKEFLVNKFENFGPYEDAILKGDPLLFHSKLSPLLNTGLLTPKYVIEEALEYAEKNNLKINSIEGFIRQIIGWREFMRYTYLRRGVKMRNGNFFKHFNRINKRFYEGTTGLVPFDDSILDLKKGAYTHHIIRLMVFGNLFLLLEVDPNEVYRWFMELFIDAYDWVMVPNVYGMSQFADGKNIVTKPYFSGSSYIKKMSDYTGREISSDNSLIESVRLRLDLKSLSWDQVWDGLFWRFIEKNKKELLINPRISLLISQIPKNNEKIKIGNEYFTQFYS